MNARLQARVSKPRPPEFTPRLRDLAMSEVRKFRTRLNAIAPEYFAVSWTLLMLGALGQMAEPIFSLWGVK